MSLEHIDPGGPRAEGQEVREEQGGGSSFLGARVLVGPGGLTLSDGKLGEWGAEGPCGQGGSPPRRSSRGEMMAAGPRSGGEKGSGQEFLLVTHPQLVLLSG